MPFGLEREIVNNEVYEHSLQHMREAGVRLPRISALADPAAAGARAAALVSVPSATRAVEARAFVVFTSPARHGGPPVLGPVG